MTEIALTPDDFPVTLTLEQAPPPPPPPPPPNGNSPFKTFIDFGAAGDGLTDDSAAINDALAWAEANETVVGGAGLKYLIASPLILATTKTHGGPKWGFRGDGCTIKSKIDNGADIFRIECRHVARYLTLNGFTLEGNSRLDGDGIVLIALNGPGGEFLYRNSIYDVVVQGAGGHGMAFAGNVFETPVQGCWTHQCGKSGFYTANSFESSVGKVSDIDFISCRSGNNGDYGFLFAVGSGSNRIQGGYSLENGKAGLRWEQLNDGATVQGMLFENNHKGAGIGGGRAHMEFVGQFHVMNSRGVTQSGGKGGDEYLISANITQPSTMYNCGHLLSGSGATLKCANITGAADKKSHVMATACDKDIDTGPGVTLWANGCSGAGLDPRGVVTR